MDSRLSSCPTRLAALEEEQGALRAKMKLRGDHNGGNNAPPPERRTLSPRSRARLDAAELLGGMDMGMGVGLSGVSRSSAAPSSSVPPSVASAVPPLPLPLPPFPARRNGMAPDHAEMDRRRRRLEAEEEESKSGAGDSNMRSWQENKMQKERAYDGDQYEHDQPTLPPPRHASHIDDSHVDDRYARMQERDRRRSVGMGE